MQEEKFSVCYEREVAASPHVSCFLFTQNILSPYKMIIKNKVEHYDGHEPPCDSRLCD